MDTVVVLGRNRWLNCSKTRDAGNRVQCSIIMANNVLFCSIKCRYDGRGREVERRQYFGFGTMGRSLAMESDAEWTDNGITGNEPESAES